jgi:hypothetical protein
MGSLNSKRFSLIKSKPIEAKDKKSQIERLKKSLKKIEIEIVKIKQEENSSLDHDKMTKRACYLSLLILFIRWSIKVIDSNQEDMAISDIVNETDKLIEKGDEFMLHSLENKIRHIINLKSS